MSSEPAVRVEGLGKRYRIGGQAGAGMLRDALGGAFRRRRGAAETEFWALRDVSFELARGEMLGVVGRNGAGKSTLLKILARITEPTAGRAMVRGRVGAMLEVGTGFHPELTGRENVFLAGTVLGMTRADVRRRFDQIVAFSEVERFLDTQFKHYSSGMMMRLAFSVAAHLEPEVLIVDEVLAVGDALFRRRCMDKMRGVAGEGRTVIFVSHALQSVRELCSRALLLERGSIAHEGTPAEVIERYGALLESGEQHAATGGRLGFSRFAARLAGDTLTVESGFRVRDGFERMEFNLMVESLDGTELVHLRNDVDEVAIPAGPGEHRVGLRLAELRLAPGAYFAWARLVGERGIEQTIVDSDRVMVDVEGDNPLRHYVQPAHRWEVG